MSYVIHTKDNKFIIIDGGTENDTAYLLEFLSNIEGYDNTIDGWILTHAHPDHINAFTDIIVNYNDNINIKSIYYNFPDAEFIKKYEPDYAYTINEFNAIIDDQNILYGYIRLVNKGTYILIGVGLKPCVCGQGLGNDLMEIVKRQCSKLYPGKKIVLEVRSFNERAIKCYKKAGFKVKEIYKKDTPIGYGEFIRMEFSS
jgi:ribosomal protein S18 acetylase RimI-like enzyme